MSTSPLHSDTFRLGYRFQRHWDLPMANAFFCGELGAGLFLVSMAWDFPPGLILGLLITCIGKPFFHLSHMGVPAKSWRAILRPDRSWTSRGLIAIVVFTGAGVIHTINTFLDGVVPYGMVIQLVAAAAALVVATYQGFAMSHSTAIALWSTAMMPFASMLYAVTGGGVLVFLLQGGDVEVDALGHRASVIAAMLGAILIMLLGLVHAAYHGSPGGKVSARLLIRTQYAKWFYGVVVGAGIAVPLIALWLSDDELVARLIVAAGVLAGFYVFRVLVFKAGVYEPVMQFGSMFGANTE